MDSLLSLLKMGIFIGLIDLVACLECGRGEGWVVVVCKLLIFKYLGLYFGAAWVRFGAGLDGFCGGDLMKMLLLQSMCFFWKLLATGGIYEGGKEALEWSRISRNLPILDLLPINPLLTYQAPTNVSTKAFMRRTFGQIKYPTFEYSLQLNEITTTSLAVQDTSR